jgi:CheY-like chemotaxis protein/nitrogen-specific signal transduction histidine kinase
MSPDDRDRGLLEDLSRVNNELVNLERAMVKKNVELEKSNEQKNRVLGVAAHDLRNPLGVILSYSEFLEESARGVLNAEQREFVAVIKSTSEFMLRLVTDLLDVTAIEAGRLTLDRHPTDLSQLVRHNVALNAVLAKRKEIIVELDPLPALPTILLDPGKIEQVLNNLITNAVKFSHRGSRVRVRLTCADALVTVAVEDQGQGIPAADLSKLFTPFGKASVRTTAGEHSTGLGLAIVRNIVDGHGGRIWLESEVGKGSTFFFTLPVADVDAVIAAAATTASARILIVDDAPVNTTIAIHQLKKLGYAADVARNGLEAIAAVTTHAYDIVLMDCNMPEMDGFAATEEIRRREGSAKHTIVIAMTASVLGLAREKCLASGMDDYITKPVKSDALRAVLERWLPRPNTTPPGPG